MNTSDAPVVGMVVEFNRARATVTLVSSNGDVFTDTIGEYTRFAGPISWAKHIDGGSLRIVSRPDANACPSTVVRNGETLRCNKPRGHLYLQHGDGVNGWHDATADVIAAEKAAHPLITASYGEPLRDQNGAVLVSPVTTAEIARLQGMVREATATIVKVTARATAAEQRATRMADDSGELLSKMKDVEAENSRLRREVERLGRRK